MPVCTTISGSVPACIRLIICVILIHLPGYLSAQVYENFDSLEQAYTDGNYSSENKLDILESLAELSDPQKKLKYSMLLIEAAEDAGSREYLYAGYLQKGNSYLLKSDLTMALENYFEAAAIASAASLENDEGRVNIAIADVYSIRGNHKNAVHYYHRAIDKLRQVGDSLGVATALENMGDEYLNIAMPDSAMHYFSQSGRIFQNLNHAEGMAANMGNKGIAMAELGMDDSAKVMINRSVTRFELLENYYPISVYLTYMSDIYLNQGNRIVAMNYARRSLQIAEKYGLKDQISEANLKISSLFESAGDPDSSLAYYKNFVAYKDSVTNLAAVQEMANMRTDFEIAQKQLEVDSLNAQKRSQTIIVIAVVIALVLLGILAIGLYRRNRFINRTNRIIEYEKGRSDRLLRNILPDDTAHELKEKGRVKARKIESVSVMFTDFKDFTKLSESFTPEQLVRSVDFYFSKFDEIIEKYGLEKIKTMGDAYMCASGLPFPVKNHALRVTMAAFEIVEFVESVKLNDDKDLAHFEVRVGINTGPVVAGVVGTKKFAYDIWGDTVNIAARMESNSMPGKINVSESTHQLIRDYFDCRFRGEIEVKNKGMQRMYFVSLGQSMLEKAIEEIERTTEIVH